ncbi:MAG: peptidylprolyl isomerase [Planctomycetes bacterium]|nr:peptidylprolyl isomerase [Planctomycetota bacterium]
MVEAKVLAIVMMLLSPMRHYFQFGHPVEVALDRAAVLKALDNDAEAAKKLRLVLLTPAGEAVASADAPEGKESLDLTAMFPKRQPPMRPEWLWDGKTYYVQLAAGDKAIGAPLVVTPVLTPHDPRPRFPDALRIDVEQRVVLHTSMGDVAIALSPEAAPHTGLNFKRLVGDGFYTNIKVHRIVPDFVVQLGDPTGTGGGSPGYYIDLEPSAKVHAKGTVSMARTGNDENSNGSQIFICLTRERCAAMDGKYSAFGDVVEGWDVVEKIAHAPADPVSGRPTDPPVIQSSSLVLAPPRNVGN